jgi:hypothetical protein
MEKNSAAVPAAVVGASRPHRRGQDALATAGKVPAPPKTSTEYDLSRMRYILRFLWNATRGHHLAPWRSPYLLWRIETYCGVKMQQIGVLEFWEFTWRERKNLWRFLKWTAEMERYAHPKPKSS